jgi:hypothetical protein
MIRRSEYFETIDKYLNNELTEPELSELELELKFNSDLSEELNLHLDVEQAVQEHDVVSLRETLNRIAVDQGITNTVEEFNFTNSFNFGLADELSSSKNFSRSVNAEDIVNFTQSFPKIHLYQHSVAAKENIHQFYKEEADFEYLAEEESFSQIENTLFEDIKNALEEKDVLDVRANLRQIASTMPEHSRTTEEIDKFIYNLLSPEENAEFEQEIAFNASLANDVRLHKEIDLAAAEADIMELRASLKQIHRSEYQTASRVEEIEGYLYNTLTESELASFEAELADNKELYNEIDLMKNIDQAIQEKDIMQLRERLGNISREQATEKQSERSIAIRFKPRRFAIGVVAASLILLLGISGLMKLASDDGSIYEQYYSRYDGLNVTRSENIASNIDQKLTIALQKFNNQDYETALNLLQEVTASDKDNPVSLFYSGVAFQELGKYESAITEYQAVVLNKDNLFIEQAEWYIGLCYLQTNESKKAIKQFRKIAGEKGFYQPKAVAILNKLEELN